MLKKLLIGSFVFLSLQFNAAQETQKQLDQIIREWAAPDKFPDHVILSATEDPSNSISVNWRTHANNTVGYLEIAPAGPGPDFRNNAKTYPAIRTLVNSSEASKDGFKSSFFDVEPPNKPINQDNLFLSYYLVLEGKFFFCYQRSNHQHIRL